MPGGLNTDIEYGGHVYHVQTEASGRTDPAIETVVFRAGEALARVKAPCARAEDPFGREADALWHAMRNQHRAVLRNVIHGTLDRPPTVSRAPSRRAGPSVVIRWKPRPRTRLVIVVPRWTTARRSTSATAP
jgi:hypothetical protein